MTDLFPPIEPYATDYLKVSESHTIFVEQAGNPKGKPVVYLHGGPGAGNSSVTRQFFDPEIYHIIHFDQRGCGQSTPHASLEENTTWHIVDDMEKSGSTAGSINGKCVVDLGAAHWFWHMHKNFRNG